MNFVIFLVIYFILISILVMGGRKFYNRIGTNYEFLNKIKNKKWFQNHWICGLIVLFQNALLFSIASVLIYLISLPDILHDIMDLQYFFIIVVLTITLTGSFLLWIIVRNIWQGTFANRMKMSIIGSSFYVLVELVCIYNFISTDYPLPDKELYFANLTLVIEAALMFLANFIILGFRRIES